MVESTETDIAKTLDTKLRANFDITELHIKDVSGGCGQSFQVIVICESFKEIKLLERQKKVNEVLSEEIAKIHAMELKTWTPEQWENKKSQFDV